jgi:threonine/homoserine/homoserine lactone efflux protein
MHGHANRGSGKRVAPRRAATAGSAHDLRARLPVTDHRRPAGGGAAAARLDAEVDHPAVVTAALVAGLTAGYGIAVPVGAVATYLVSLTARAGLRVGVAAALGVATADGAYALLATLGGATLAHAVRPALGPLRWLSALVLVALAVRGTVTAVRRYRGPAAGPPDRPGGPARAYLRLWAVTMLNPMTLVYFTALVLGGHPAAGGPDRAAFVAAAFTASASWQLLLATGGAVLGRVLGGPRGRLGTAVVSGALITGLAVHLVN